MVSVPRGYHNWFNLQYMGTYCFRKPAVLKPDSPFLKKEIEDDVWVRRFYPYQYWTIPGELQGLYNRAYITGLISQGLYHRVYITGFIL